MTNPRASVMECEDFVEHSGAKGRGILLAAGEAEYSAPTTVTAISDLTNRNDVNLSWSHKVARKGAAGLSEDASFDALFTAKPENLLALPHDKDPLNESNGRICYKCQNCLGYSNSLILVPCGHVFHEKCVKVPQRAHAADAGACPACCALFTSSNRIFLNQNCPVCLEGEWLSRKCTCFSPCGHVLHNKCHKKTLSHGLRNCPLCNQNISSTTKAFLKHDIDAEAEELMLSIRRSSEVVDIEHALANIVEFVHLHDPREQRTETAQLVRRSSAISRAGGVEVILGTIHALADGLLRRCFAISTAGGVEVILDTIHALEDWSDAKNYALSVLARLCFSSDDSKREFLRYGGMSMLIERFDMGGISAEFAAYATHYLIRLRSTHESFVALGGIKHVAAAMRRVIDDAELQYSGCYIIFYLSSNSDYLEELEKEGCFSLAAMAYETYPNYLRMKYRFAIVMKRYKAFIASSKSKESL